MTTTSASSWKRERAGDERSPRGNLTYAESPGDRLRSPVRPADRPADARVPRVLRDRSPRHPGGRPGRGASVRHHPVGRAQVRVFARSAGCGSGDVLAGRSGARDLLRATGDGEGPGRRGRPHRDRRVRQERPIGERAFVRPVRRATRRASRVDEPQRRGRPRARGFPAGRPPRRPRPSPRSRIRSTGSTAFSSIPRCRTRRAARTS